MKHGGYITGGADILALQRRGSGGKYPEDEEDAIEDKQVPQLPKSAPQNGAYRKDEKHEQGDRQGSLVSV